ncbi:MAG: beta-ketoacyl-ACP synthase III [Streptosporangiaceae bacterium]
MWDKVQVLRERAVQEGSEMAFALRVPVLCGLSSWTPENVVTNDHLAAVLDTSDEWIRSRTGVVRRHVADDGMATSDLAAEAGKRALKSAGIDAVDALILATTTPDRPCPATAPEVASRLGLGTIAAFDIAAVCSGFIYALANGAGLIAAGIADRVLVICAEVFTSILNPHDRTTRAIFGDGAGAVVLRAGDLDETGAIGPFVLGSDGRGADLIMVPAGGSRQPYRGDGSAEQERYFVMQGQAVYRKAIDAMTQSTIQVLELAKWPIDSVDRLVCHQANRRIITAVAARLGIPADRCVINIDHVGNTAAASIPIALDYGVKYGALRPGDRVVLTGFGGGLTWGSTLLRWPESIVEAD